MAVPEELMAMAGGAPAADVGAAEPMAEEAPEGDYTPEEQEILNMLQDILRDESDSAAQAELGDIITRLAKYLASNEDEVMKAMGGNPKQMRAVGGAYSQ